MYPNIIQSAIAVDKCFFLNEKAFMFSLISLQKYLKNCIIETGSYHFNDYVKLCWKGFFFNNLYIVFFEIFLTH